MEGIMKRKFKISLALVLMLLLIPTITRAQEGLKLWVNGDYVNSDVESFIENGRTLVPVRVISETLGFKVEWNQADQEVLIKTSESEDAKVLSLKINNTKALFGDKEFDLDVAPKISQSRTFVPLRFISEAFGLKVDWDEENKTAIVGDGYVAPALTNVVPIVSQVTNNNYYDNLKESPYPDRLIKGNINSKGEKIYHCPGQRDYKKTVIDESDGERWFATEEEARNAGWRKAQR